jgi:hypothetical protein
VQKFEMAPIIAPMEQVQRLHRVLCQLSPALLRYFAHVVPEMGMMREIVSGSYCVSTLSRFPSLASCDSLSSSRRYSCSLQSEMVSMRDNRQSQMRVLDAERHRNVSDWI